MDENNKLNALNDDLLEAIAGGLEGVEEKFFSALISAYKEQGAKIDDVLAVVDGAYGDQPKKKNELYWFILETWQASLDRIRARSTAMF